MSFWTPSTGKIMQIVVPAISTALTANGTTAGVVTIASTTDVYPGVKGWLSGTALTSREIVVMRVLTATTFVARFVEGPPRVASDLSAYTTAATARYDQVSQLAEVVPVTAKIPSAP